MSMNAFWPFAYPLKAYDIPLHPAFLPTTYRALPQIPTYGSQTHQQTNSPSPTAKSDKFSIDAILNRDKRTESSNSSPIHSEREREIRHHAAHHVKSLSDFVLKSDKLDEEEMTSQQRRHQRLLEAAHPYLSHHTSGLTEKGYLQKHMPSPYKQFTESVRNEKGDKKSSQSSESWSKQAKGKRVRTIFTPEQLERLEAEFERQQYMVGTERYYLASSLNLTEAQVKVWFQNRRIKWRKQHLEQQQAKLKTMDIYRTAESCSDSESDDETYSSHDITHDVSRDVISPSAENLSDPFHSPKEARCTQ